MGTRRTFAAFTSVAAAAALSAGAGIGAPTLGEGMMVAL